MHRRKQKKKEKEKKKEPEGPSKAELLAAAREEQKRAQNKKRAEREAAAAAKKLEKAAAKKETQASSAKRKLRDARKIADAGGPPSTADVADGASYRAMVKANRQRARDEAMLGKLVDDDKDEREKSQSSERETRDARPDDATSRSASSEGQTFKKVVPKRAGRGTAATWIRAESATRRANRGRLSTGTRRSARPSRARSSSAGWKTSSATSTPR